MRPLAKVKNLPPSVPPRLRGEARKIRLPDRDFGEGWGGVSAFLQEVYALPRWSLVKSQISNLKSPISNLQSQI